MFLFSFVLHQRQPNPPFEGLLACSLFVAILLKLLQHHAVCVHSASHARLFCKTLGNPVSMSAEEA